MGQRRLATELAGRAATLDAGNFSYQSQQALCLLRNKETEKAVELIDQLSSAPIVRAVDHDALGNLYSQVGDQLAAIACFRRALDIEPANAHHWFNLALCLQAAGEMDQAETAFDRCIELDPVQGEPWLHRSRLRKQVPEKNHVHALNSAVESVTGDWRREMSLRYALAKEYEDLGNYDSSFNQLQLGSRLRRSHMKHDPEADLMTIRLIKETYGRRYLEANGGYESSEPIFIVGLPRTGTTLVERILGSHSKVFAAGELNNFAECLTAQVVAMKPANRLDFVRLSARADSDQLGRQYVESTRPQTGHCEYFIDKLPLNFLYCGLIHRALPNAKIVHLKRDPMDTCFAIYKTLFRQAYPFSYEQRELAEYYLAYRDLMEHWHQVMPGKIFDVEYESLVADLEPQSRRLLEFCGLSWEDSCLHFHLSEAPSMTASLAQVRQPVYTSSVGKWRHYADHLGTLHEVLTGSGIDV